MNYSIKIKLVVLSMLVALTSCMNNKGMITKSQDYEAYLFQEETTALELANADREFWEDKLNETPDQFPYHAKLSASYAKLFSLTGNIKHLKTSEDHLLLVNEKTHYNNASYLRSLAHNYISQHRFKEALRLLQKAELNGEDLRSTEKMMFDVQMELGNYEIAKVYLEHIKDLSDFDYLIRLGKWSDHKGNLDAAIDYMEKAMAIAESSNRPSLKQWIYTNLADFYGHDGQIKESYKYYLKALELDPTDAYAKKGIAWIVYSYEKNAVEALRILDEISKHHQSPDYHLFKAEIADYIGDSKRMKEELKIYNEEIGHLDYGDMYNKYKVLQLCDTKKMASRAIDIAKIEVKERPTPQSYDLLAWAYFNNDEIDKALDIVNTYVYGHTYEPEALYHVAEIYKAVGKDDKVRPIKDELLGSIYELGPTMKEKIVKL